MNGKKADAAWTWLTRGLAVAGFIYLLASPSGYDAPVGAYVLLLGLFFGPEVVKGQIQLNERSRNGKNGK